MKLSLLAQGLVITGISLGGTGCSTPPASAPPIRIRWAHDPESLDPLALPNQLAVDATNLLHGCLLQIDFAGQNWQPLLAESLPQVRLLGDSVTLLDYRLRPQATWDSGRPVLATDVAFTLKLMHCPGLALESARSQFGFIREVQFDAADPLRFTLRCRGQSPDFATASGDWPVLPEAVLDPAKKLRRYSLAQLQDRPATAPPDSVLAGQARRYLAATAAAPPNFMTGCGPYQLVAWQKDQRLRFRRKAGWWGPRVQPTPFVLQAAAEALEFAIIPDDATASLALQRGTIDVYPQVPVREFQRLRQLKSTQDKLRFYTAATYDVVTAGFNTRRPALADAGTRRALSRLFDAAGLLRATQQGEGRRTVGLVNPTDRLNYNDSLVLVPFRPAETAALLQQAGWRRSTTGWHRPGPQGVPQQLALTMRYRADEASFETVGLQFRAAAAQLGIPVQLRPTESATLTPSLQAGDFDIYVRTLRGNPFLFNFAPILHSKSVGEGNFTGYGSPASDRLIEAVALAESPDLRARLLRRLQARLQADAPLVPLYFLPRRLAAAQNLTGLHVSGLKPGYAAAAMRRGAAPATR